MRGSRETRFREEEGLEGTDLDVFIESLSAAVRWT